ncbi:helix-turn-helix transcriptional regulator [Cohnella sp. REN36]|uniref:ArsR/SmtB family transcription factor n=1 Tax=Cohnella sp. REN36 TaxID=2887347 RepID=UPI001D1472A6|nr:metalloregulator ArsR/SmtB family transcription factor [Cohnella sp. REN36]MCC3375539.1 metalloregulator ArsR/SmtB family transcription factor [Cohnella sp. REN36]
MANDHDSFQDAVKVYKALGEPTRLSIVELLVRHRDLSCSDIGDRLDQVAGSTLSHHLKQLTDCGLVEITKSGTFHYHHVNEDMLRRYAPLMLEGAERE